MKTLYLSLAGSICVAVAVGILTISGAIDMSSLLHIQQTSYHKCCSLPTLPGVAISINGTSSVDQFLQFDTRPGQNITLLVNVTTEPKTLPMTLSASPKLGFSKADGINWQLSSNQINSTSSVVLLHISIGNNVRPAKYPMEIDVNTQAISNVNFTEVDYFTLAVVSPTSSTAQNVSEPSCVTNISNQTVFSGYAGSLSCPVMPFYMSVTLVNYTGFYGMYDTINNETVVGQDTYPDNPLQEELDRSGDSRMVGNFVLEPGHTGTITYTATVHLPKCGGPCPDGIKFPSVVNETNLTDFSHRQKNEMVHSHYGIGVTYDPLSESLRDGETLTLKSTIAVSPDTPHGTYWIILAPGNCAGGPLILLTVSECEK